MPVIFTVPVVLAQRVKSGEDSFGNDVYALTDVPTVGVFAPGGSAELVQGQDLVTTQPTVFLPTGTDVSAIDALTVNGLSFEVDGDPRVWPPHPMTGWQPEYSVQVPLRRVTG